MNSYNKLISSIANLEYNLASDQKIEMNTLRN